MPSFSPGPRLPAMSLHGSGPPRVAVIASWAVVVLAGAAAALGLTWHGNYQDEETFIDAGWWGNDLAALVVLVPALAVGTWSAARGSRIGVLVWLGALDAMAYNYAFYAFGAAPNRLFVVHAAILALSLAALVAGLVTLQPSRVASIGKRARIWIAAYMAIWALLLGALWLSQAIGFAAGGQTPDLNGSTRAFAVTATLDLAFVVPYVAVAAWLLWKNHPWGGPAAAILNVKGILYPAVLVASSITAHRAGVPEALMLLPLWFAFLAASGLATWALLAPQRRMP